MNFPRTASTILLFLSCLIGLSTPSLAQEPAALQTHSLFMGDLKVAAQTDRVLEFMLKTGEQLVIHAQGVEDEPVSTFRVREITQGLQLMELSERSTIDVEVPIPQDGAYQLYFFNNSSFFDKIFQVDIKLRSADMQVNQLSRQVVYDEEVQATPTALISTTGGMNVTIMNQPAAYFPFTVDTSMAGTAVAAVGVEGVAKPWTDQLKNLIATRIPGTSFYTEGATGNLGDVSLKTGEPLYWLILSKQAFGAYTQGASVPCVIESRESTAQVTRTNITPGEYVLVVKSANPQTRYFVELWVEKKAVRRTVKS